MTEHGWIIVDRSMVGLDWWTVGPLYRTQEEAVAKLPSCEDADDGQYAVAEVRITGLYITGPLFSEPSPTLDDLRVDSILGDSDD